MTDLTREGLVETPWRMPFHQFTWGWLMFRILMAWPLSIYDKAPAYLHGWAGRYAHDERNFRARAMEAGRG